MARIFISYKRVDKDKVFKIKDQIESALGEKCWIDLDGIESDVQFAQVILHAINQCEVVLFMYSKEHSQIKDFENDWTIRELSYAARKGKRIIIVNIDQSCLSGMFEFMYGLKRQVDGTSSQSIDKLIHDLFIWLDIKQILPSTKFKQKASEKEQFDIFISYSRKDAHLIAPILSTLENHDIKIWVDTSRIEYGDTFPDRIAEALDNSDSVLFMCTSNSIEASYCKKEIGYARRQGKKIRAILVNGEMPIKGWFALEYQDVNCVNITDKNAEQILLKELERVYSSEKSEEHKHNILLAKDEIERIVRGKSGEEIRKMTAQPCETETRRSEMVHKRCGLGVALVKSNKSRLKKLILAEQTYKKIPILFVLLSIILII